MDVDTLRVANYAVLLRLYMHLAYIDIFMLCSLGKTNSKHMKSYHGMRGSRSGPETATWL